MNFENLKLVTALVPVLVFGTATATFAQSTSAPECFQFKSSDLPSAIDIDVQLPGSAPLKKWCYQRKNYGTEKVIFIFNADTDTIKPELTALVYLDQEGQPAKMSVGSLSRGKLHFHHLPDLALNPFSIPLLPEQARAQAESLSGETAMNALSNSDFAAKVSNQHWLFATKADPLTVVAGDYAYSVGYANEPFNGFWWSNEGVPMATGPNSPLGIYDAGIAARGQANPKSSVWEQAHHSDVSTEWGGHCNGWVASTALYAEPTRTLYDPLTRTMVTPYAQKGMLAEASFCVNEAFFGKRYTGAPTDDIRDIHPDLFHKTLVQYIFTQGKTVAMDYERGVDVDNNIITGYRFRIAKTDSSILGFTYHVDAVLTVAQYDVNQGDSIGKAGTYEKSYAYTLTTDKKGNITGGSWDATSDNPDFMWVPLSPSEKCTPRNPQVSPAQVSRLLASLSSTRSIYTPLNFNVTAPMGPQDQVAVPLQIEAGDLMQLYVGVRSISPNQNPGVLLIVSGNARYPVTGGEKESMFIALPNGNSVLPLDRLLSIDSIAVVNQSASVTSNVDLTVQGIQYLAP